MAPARPPRHYRISRERPYRTARERVAMRRAAHSQHFRLKPGGSGCKSLVVGLLAILTLIVVALAAFAQLASRSINQIVIESPQMLATDTTQATPEGNTSVDLPSTTLKPFNVLLIGVDSRDSPDEGVRSDTLIVVHVDPIQKWASMLSIPRDSMVQIPLLGLQKINVAYAYGHTNAAELYGRGTNPAAAGGELVASTVEQFLNIKIDYTAQVDFHGFERLVDTFGGLMLDIPQPLLDPEYPTENYGFERLYIPAGLQVLDGKTALRYARSRHSGSDFDRSCRQQRVLRAALREVRQRNIIEQISLLPDLVGNLEQSIKTTMPINDLGVVRGLLELAQSLSSDRIIQFSINPDNVNVISEQGSDIYWDKNDIKLLVDRMMAGPEAVEKVAHVQVQNGTGIHGLATRVTRNLSAQGFATVDPDDAPTEYEHTHIIDYSGNAETLQQLVDFLRIERAYVQEAPDENTPPAPFNTDIVVTLGADYQERWAAITQPTSVAPAAPPSAPAIATPAEDVPAMPSGCSLEY